MINRPNLIGRKFGRLTVIKQADSNKYHNRQWICKCSCGNTSKTTTAYLRSGDTKSCGCLKRDKFYSLITKHNGANDPEYLIWLAAKQRCTNSKNKDWKNYGGRGIAMCTKWFSSYKVFIKDMGKRPNASYSIDRINNNGDYEPSNCRWATRREQNLNTRRN